MSDHDAMLQAVIDAPDDDAPRLIFADWLDEHGDPDRAEFIRVQCQMAQLDFYDPLHAKLERRSSELYTTNWPKWRMPWLDCLQVFRRGFVEELRISTLLFMCSAEKICASVPIRWVHLGIPEMIRPIEWKHLSSLIGIEFYSRPPGQSTEWQNIVLPKLRWLKCTGLDSTAGFLSAGCCPNLEVLDLSNSSCDPDQFRSFLRATDLRRLRGFALNAPGDGALQFRMRAAGARVLAEAGLSELRLLSLHGQLIGEGGLAHIARSRSLGNLEELNLDDNDIGAIGPTGIADLCASTTRRRLRGLSLAGNPIGAFAIEELAAWPGLRQLRRLNLSRCGLTADDVRPLADSPYLHPKLRMRLEGNRFEPKKLFAAENLAASSSLS